MQYYFSNYQNDYHIYNNYFGSKPMPEVHDKVTLRIATEGPQNIFLKSTKNMKLCSFFSGLQSFNNPSYKLFDVTFERSVYPKFSFLFWSQDTFRYTQT